MSLTRKNLISLLAGLAISVGLMWWAARDLLSEPEAFQRFGAEFADADYRTLVPFLGVLVLFYWLKAWRWRLLLAPVGNFRPVRDLLGPILIGFGLNNVFPARLGEFVRCFVFSRRHQVPLPVVLSTLILERVFDAIAIVVYMSVGLLFVKGLDPLIQRSAYIASAVALGLALMGLAYVIWTGPMVAFLEACFSRVPFIPQALVGKVCRMLEAGAQGLSALKNVPLMCVILFISLLKWSLNIILIWLALWSFGIHVPLPVTMVLMGVVAFSVAIPAVPGYFGVIQAAFMAVLELFVDQRESILAASICYHLAQWIPVTIIGLILFGLRGLNLRDVQRSEVAVEDAVDAEPKAASGD